MFTSSAWEKITCQMPMYINSKNCPTCRTLQQGGLPYLQGEVYSYFNTPYKLGGGGGGVQALDKRRVHAHWNLGGPSTSPNSPITFELDPAMQRATAQFLIYIDFHIQVESEHLIGISSHRRNHKQIMLSELKGRKLLSLRNKTSISLNVAFIQIFLEQIFTHDFNIIILKFQVSSQVNLLFYLQKKIVEIFFTKVEYFLKNSILLYFTPLRFCFIDDIYFQPFI